MYCSCLMNNALDAGPKNKKDVETQNTGLLDAIQTLT